MPRTRSVVVVAVAPTVPLDLARVIRTAKTPTLPPLTKQRIFPIHTA